MGLVEVDISKVSYCTWKECMSVGVLYSEWGASGGNKNDICLRRDLIFI